MTVRRIAVTALPLAAVVAAACASGGGGTASHSADCALRQQDSVFAARAPVYRECAVDIKARLITTDLRPDFRPTNGGTTCYSVDVEFVVDTLGAVEPKTISVIRTNSDPFTESVTLLLPRLRYEPAKRGGVVVRQIVNEHKTMSTVVVVTKAGSPPPPKGTISAPRC